MISKLPLSIHSPELRIARVKSRLNFSSLPLLAGIVDPDQGRVYETLRSGKLRNLEQVLDHFESKRETLKLSDNLRKDWGPFLEELVCLSQEPDRETLYYSLLELGGRLQRDGAAEKSARVYFALVGTQEAPEGVRKKAKEQLLTITGGGSGWRRFGYSLSQLPEELTHVTPLLAMTGAGLAFKGTRLALSLRWGERFESAWALNAAATSAAFATETVVFTGLEMGLGELGGVRQDWSAKNVYRHWGSGAATLLGLKAAGSAVRSGVARMYGGSPVRSVSRTVTEKLAPQIGMFTGVLAGNRLAEWQGFHEAQHGDSWLVTGAASVIRLNAVGMIQQRTNVFKNLELTTNVYQTKLPKTFGLSGRFLSFVQQNSPRLGPQWATPEGIWMSSQEEGSGARGIPPSRTEIGLERPALRSFSHQGAVRVRDGSMVFDLISQKPIEQNGQLWVNQWHDLLWRLLIKEPIRNIDKRITGPVGALLRQNDTLLKMILHHLDSPQHRILAGVDLDSNILRYLVATDSHGRPSLVIFGEDHLHSSEGNLAHDRVFRVRTSSSSGQLEMEASLYHYKALGSELLNRGSMKSGTEDGKKIFLRAGDPQLRIEIEPGSSEIWKIFNGDGRLLLSIGAQGVAVGGEPLLDRPILISPIPDLKPSSAPAPAKKAPDIDGTNTLAKAEGGAPKAAASADDTSAMPSPTRTPRAKRPAPDGVPGIVDASATGAPVKDGPKVSDLPPAPRPAKEVKMLAEAATQWGAVLLDLEAKKELPTLEFRKLTTLLSKMPPAMVEEFFCNIAPDGGMRPLLSAPDFELLPYLRALERLPAPRRVFMIQAIAAHLGEASRVGVRAFEILREAMPTLSTEELSGLETFLNSLPASATRSPTSLVTQTKKLIVERRAGPAPDASANAAPVPTVVAAKIPAIPNPLPASSWEKPAKVAEKTEAGSKRSRASDTKASPGKKLTLPEQAWRFWSEEISAASPDARLEASIFARLSHYVQGMSPEEVEHFLHLASQDLSSALARKDFKIEPLTDALAKIPLDHRMPFIEYMVPRLADPSRASLRAYNILQNAISSLEAPQLESLSAMLDGIPADSLQASQTNLLAQTRGLISERKSVLTLRSSPVRIRLPNTRP